MCGSIFWFTIPPGLHVGKKNKSGDVPVVGTIDSFDGPWVRNAFQSDVPGVGTVNSGDVTTIPGVGMGYNEIEPDITITRTV